MKTIIHEKLVLTAMAIDDFSFDLQAALVKSGCKKEEILKARLSVEDILFQWLERGLQDQPLEVELIKKLRNYVITVSVCGDKVNPLQQDEDDPLGAELHGFIMAASQQINYSYDTNVNRVTLRMGDTGVTHMLRILIAIVMALVCGFAIRTLIPTAIPYIEGNYVTPTFEVLLGILTAVVAPYVFVSVITGIVTMGDPKQLNTIGKKVMVTFFGALAFLILLTGLIAAVVMPFSSVEAIGMDGFFATLWGLILKFLPTNIMTPFAEKKMMQIIFMAVVLGISILYMRETMDEVVKLILAFEKLLSSILRFICSFEAILIFFGLLKVMLEDVSNLAELAAAIIGANLLIYVLVFAVMAIILRIRLNGNVRRVLRKMFIPASVGLMTASSTAAFPQLMACCERKLGIQHQLVVFAVPFGQVIFKPGSGIRLFLMTMLCMYFYGMPMGVFSILLVGFLSYMLSMMIPPVAEGGVAALTILFTYMQIPVESLAIAITLSVFVDFVSTFINIYSNQIFILLAALRMKMVDTDILYRL